MKTVLLPLGTLEPHGVMANGADITDKVAGLVQDAIRRRDDAGL
jgi:hypothetical protein